MVFYDTTTGNNANGIVGATASIVTSANLAGEFRPYYEVKNNYMVWYDFAVIKLSHLFESLGKMGLVRRFDATLGYVRGHGYQVIWGKLH